MSIEHKGGMIVADHWRYDRLARILTLDTGLTSIFFTLTQQQAEHVDACAHTVMKAQAAQPQNANERNEQRQYWAIKEEHGLLHLLDVDKHLYVYVKWDGELHIWYYDDDAIGFDHDTGIEDHSDWGFTGKSHHDYYRMTDIDEELARLQSLRALAVAWFAKQGKRFPPDWEGYRKGGMSIEQAQALKAADAQPENAVLDQATAEDRAYALLTAHQSVTMHFEYEGRIYEGIAYEVEKESHG